jgi:hypothetical protein
MGKIMRFKLSGRIPEDDIAHQVAAVRPMGLAAWPNWIYIPGVGFVPQYAPTVYGENDGYDPANDCDGNFASFKYQVHNNCYNYALDIATNSFAHPGRMHGLQMPGDIDADWVVICAQKDGLILVASGDIALDELHRKEPHLRDGREGHLVALLIAPADHSAGFGGDFHWVRCDDFESSDWSQKDGPDQMTTFDFAGDTIRDPSRANWTVNNGPLDTTKPGGSDYYFTYRLRAWMFVPHTDIMVI